MLCLCTFPWRRLATELSLDEAETHDEAGFGDDIFACVQHSRWGDAMTGWRDRKVLVTGAGGFIGSHLVEFLVQEGADVRGFIRYNSRNDYGHLSESSPEVLQAVDIYAGDLADQDAVAGAVEGRDVVFHLGALIPIPYSFRHPREYVASNIEGTVNVLQASRSAGVTRLVQTSSSEVYGSAITVPISEDHPLRAQSPYAATKVAADQLALSFHRAFAVPVVVARPFNTYGPRQSARAIIPTIATQALTREVVEVGSLHPTRDFLFVADTVRGLARCGEAEGVEGETFNLGTNSEISVGELAQQIVDALGSEARIQSVAERTRPHEAEVLRLVADASKARAALNWEPQTSFHDGLHQTLDWIRARLEIYKPTLYNI